MSYLVETAPPRHRGLVGSWSVCGGVAGILLGSLVASVVTSLVGEAAMSDWGWRVPFLLSAVIFVLGSWLRRSLAESPEFEAAAESGATEGNPLKEVLQQLPLRVLHLSSSILLFATSFYLLFVWMPTYLTDIVQPPVAHALMINTATMALLLLMIPLGGHLSDRFGRKPVMLWATAIMGVSIYPLFLVIDHGVMIQALMIQTGLAILIGMIQGPLPAFMVECFPVNNRYTAIGLSYNITLALFGGTAPMVATWLIKVTGNIASPALYLAVLAVISVVAMATLKPLERPA